MDYAMRVKAELKWGALTLEELVEYTEFSEAKVREALGYMYAESKVAPCTDEMTGDTCWELSTHD